MRWQDGLRPYLPPVLLDLARLVREADNPRGLWHYLRSDRVCSGDPYVAWLCQVSGGWLDPTSGNIRAFYHALKNLPVDSCVLEIGSFLGLSTNIMSYFLHKLGCKARFYSTDPWIFEAAEDLIGGFFDASSAEYRASVKQVFLENGKLFGGARRSHAFELTSDDFFQRWSLGGTGTDLYDREVFLGGRFGFVYIDGNHSYEQCRKDFENSDLYLTVGGFVLFDDSADAGQHEGCRRVVAEVQASGRYRKVFRQPNYLFQKVR